MVSTLKPGIVMETSEVFETSDLPESDQYYFPGRFYVGLIIKGGFAGSVFMFISRNQRIKGTKNSFLPW